MLQQIVEHLSQRLHSGTMQVRLEDGRRFTIGSGTPEAGIRVKDAATLRSIVTNPHLRFGETYMEGGWEPEGCALLDVLEVAMRNRRDLLSQGSLRLRAARARMREWNNSLRAQRNAQHHYDIDTPVYRAFLDAEMHYSCAYFARPEMTLEEAQQAKCAHIARKLDLQPGARVLDIGCGWGSMALHLARHHDVHVTGITLSPEQLRVAQERVSREGLNERVALRLEDYRNTRGRFDAVVSIGMFEHVGRPQYQRFFDTVHDKLEDDGVALIHTIGRSTPPDEGNAWISKYIFPGGYIPAASEVTTPIERSPLILTDFEIWRLHYAETLAEWHRRFQHARTAIAERMGERFCRMWEFYLISCEATFRWGGLVVFQLQLSRGNARLPLTRDYLYG